MKINGNAIRPGNVIEHKGHLWRAVKIQHTQPGKGGAYLQVELKDIRDGTKLNERIFTSSRPAPSPSWTRKLTIR
jgi:elongation factor P